jgi:hypothetical protein
VSFCVFILAYSFSSSQGAIFTDTQNLPYLNGEYYKLISDIGILLIASIILGTLITAYSFVTLYLVDSDKWYIGLIGVIISGVIGCVILLALRWIYHKFGLKILS